MARLIALLRGINVGGHRVKMSDLQSHLSALGLEGVETVIASGNVLFESDRKADRSLEEEIETHLERALGYAVATFVRTIPELEKVASQGPFGAAGESADEVTYAIFTRVAVPAPLEREIAALATANDEARAGRRVVYWHRRTRCRESETFGASLGKLLGSETTSRNLTTVRRIVERYR
jgi:uncharacterized protein (DUF1697 family)